MTRGAEGLSGGGSGEQEEEAWQGGGKLHPCMGSQSQLDQPQRVHARGTLSSFYSFPHPQAPMEFPCWVDY